MFVLSLVGGLRDIFRVFLFGLAEMRHGLVHIVVLELDVLVKGPLRPVGLLAGLDGTAVVPLNLAGRPPESLLLVLFVGAAVLDLVCFFLSWRGRYFQLGHAGHQVGALADELLHLGGEDHIGEVQATVLVVVVEVGIVVGATRSGLGNAYER